MFILVLILQTCSEVLVLMNSCFCQSMTFQSSHVTGLDMINVFISDGYA